MLAQAAAERIADMLDETADTGARVEGTEVVFGPVALSGMGRGNILVPFDSGRFSVEVEGEALRVRYRLSTVRLMLIVTGVLAAFGVLFILGKTLRHEDWHDAVRFFAFGWPWLFGMNYLTGAVRIPLWLKRGLRDLA
jgi:hypothetical protein